MPEDDDETPIVASLVVILQQLCTFV